MSLFGKKEGTSRALGGAYKAIHELDEMTLGVDVWFTEEDLGETNDADGRYEMR